ncbi:B3 domain-containing protein [Apostasia shenzhenica]|uniref:B3 domain-containing protein n=1 Tax=Apostasia shenzhenica TaxID=1088818 RepID=A0A2I0B0E2_9ASPA|nr:B3 domain-containing protein [Apostasia shenzhenica]
MKAKEDTIANGQQNKRGRKRPSSSPLSPPVPISFFKIMIGDFRDVLFVPPSIAITLKDMDGKYVNLEDSDSNSWIVKMSMVEDSLAFEKGWHDFVVAHSISVGEFVIFTYVGGLMFTARIFGTSSLERLNFPAKIVESGKEMVVAELNFRKKKTCKASDDKHCLASHNPLNLEREKEAAPCDLPNENANGNDSICRVVSVVPSTVGKFLHHHTCTKVHNKALEHDSSSLEDLIAVNVFELPKSDGESLAAIGPKSSRNCVQEKKQGAGKSEIEELTPGVQVSNVEDTRRNSEKMGPNFSYHFRMLGNESDNKNKPAFLNISDSKCTTKKDCIELEGFSDKRSHKIGLRDSVCEKATYHKMEEIELEEFPDELFDKADCLHDTVEDKLKKFADSFGVVEPGCEDSLSENDKVNFLLETHASCESEVPLPSTPTVDCAKYKKENMEPANEVDTQVKGSVLAASPYIDENNVTPCSYQKSQTEVTIERTGSVKSSSCGRRSFTIQLSHDVRNFLELPEELISGSRRLKLERKVVVLEDPLMRRWPVLYHQGISHVGFIGGWVDFARANSICKGDACELELVDEKELVFRVQIRKA